MNAPFTKGMGGPGSAGMLADMHITTMIGNLFATLNAKNLIP